MKLLILLAENFEVHFSNKNLMEDLLKCILKKWCGFTSIKHYNGKSIYIFDLMCSLIKYSYDLLKNYANDILTLCVKLLNENLHEYYVKWH